MKILAFSVAALAATAVALPAFAQTRAPAPVAPQYPWCLEERGGGPVGGPMPLLCRFNTLEQCNQSKTAPGDSCLRNPWLTR